MPVPSATQTHENKQPKTTTLNACPLNQPVTDCHAKYLVSHISFHFIYALTCLRYRGSAGNTSEKNCSIFSLFQMSLLPSARACGQ